MNEKQMMYYFLELKEQIDINKLLKLLYLAHKNINNLYMSKHLNISHNLATTIMMTLEQMDCLIKLIGQFQGYKNKILYYKCIKTPQFQEWLRRYNENSIN